MARKPIPGGDVGVWGDILNEFLDVSHAPDGSLKSNSVAETMLSPSVQDKLNTQTPGPAGPAGPQGATGPEGPKGDPGTTDYNQLQNKPDIPAQFNPIAGDNISLSGSYPDITFHSSAPTASTNLAVQTDAETVTITSSSGSGATLPAATASAAGVMSAADKAALEGKLDESAKGVAGGVATLDEQAKVPISQLPLNPTTKVLPYSFFGTLAVSTGTFRLYNDSGNLWHITSVRATVATPPGGGSIVIDVNKNGSTVFTTQANRPTIAEGQSGTGKVTNMDITQVSDGDYLTVDIDQVGVTNPGSDLVIQINTL